MSSLDFKGEWEELSPNFCKGSPKPKKKKEYVIFRDESWWYPWHIISLRVGENPSLPLVFAYAFRVTLCNLCDGIPEY